MSNQVNEFIVWDQITPVVNAGTDGDFEIIDQETPDEDRDEGWDISTSIIRRRVVSF
ncbi:MAG TPA: hypothetical protein PLC59_03775 [Bacteroidales bacterium]|jgi:hypothetical protein|nr:hypothetical protein [Bacteroidales bacterium]